MARIVVFGPHPDDQEIGMGGTVALLASQDHDVLLCDLTDGCPTPVGDRPTRLREAAAAAAALSTPGRVIPRVLLDLPNRRLEHTLAARHAVAGVIRAHRADVIFAPHPKDAHPDHLAATRIIEDARFDAKLTGVTMPLPSGVGGDGSAPVHPKWLFYYYCSHLRRVPDPTFLIDVTAHHGAKLASLTAYRSQFIDNPKNREVLEWIEAQDRFLGSRIGARYAEGFWTNEPLGLTGLGSVAGLGA
ncbi:MAG: PIG-L family deacetylase [Phycisphaeraceae bacterium]|nr:MAG: PIG-L family deacetylase [Phycisphaeraceae bacterium]